MYSLSVAMFETSREHLGNILKEIIFLKVLNGKVVFVSKVYDLIITNVDLLTNSSRSNVSRIFEEHSTNVCFYKVMKIILEVKKFNCCFVGENFNILSCNDFLNFTETVLHLE